MTSRARIVLVVVAVALSGCVGAIEEPGSASPLPAPAPSAIPELAADGPCTPLAATERVAGVSPEGDLWIDDGASLRVVRPDGTETTAARPSGPLDALAPESDAAALAIAGGELYRIEGAVVSPSSQPASDMGSAHDLCGGAGARGPGFVAATGGLFEHDGSGWWRWTTEDGAPIGPVDRLATLEGACADRAPRLYMLSGGRPVEVTYGDMPRIRIVAADIPPIDVLTRDPVLGPAALGGGTIYAGESFAPIGLDARVDTIAAGGGALWAAAGRDVYRLDTVAWSREALGGAAWSRITGALPNGATARSLHADATGAVWIAGDGAACRRAAAPSIAVRGVLPFETLAVDTIDLALTAPIGTSAIELRVDGTLVDTLEPEAAGGRIAATVSLGGAGWHELGVSALAAGETITRAITVRVGGASMGPPPAPSWARDVRPIAYAHCVRCHGAGTERDLSTHEAWVARQGAITDRLGRWDTATMGAMPPTGRLGDEELARIARWIDGGMEP